MDYQGESIAEMALASPSSYALCATQASSISWV